MEAQAVRGGLDQGDMLNWYRIDRVLGRGGFGVTYLATDTNLKTLVAIKEYRPSTAAEQDPELSTSPATPTTPSTDAANQIYQWGLDRFIAEAQTLARFSHPNIVRVLSVFEANGTAYMVMEYQQGTDLKVHLRRQPLVTEEMLKELFRPIIDGLRLVHQSGFIHRDIKPSNIMVRSDGSPVLIDFGSARKSYDSQTSTLTSLVSAGYTPLEQYNDSTDDKQGPWTDIYSCGAVLHYAITGKPPPDATQRGSALLNRSPDPLTPLSKSAAGRFSLPFLHAVDWALGFAIAERPKTLENWAARLFAKEPEQVLQEESVRPPQPVANPAISVAPQQPPEDLPIETEQWDMSFLGVPDTAPVSVNANKTVKKKPAWIVASLLTLLLAGYSVLFVFQNNGPPAISSFPVAEADKQLAQLVSAISQADLNAVAQVSEVSAQSLSLLNILFRQFKEIKVELHPVEIESDGLAATTISLVQFTRANGVVAYPANAFKNLLVILSYNDSGELLLALQ